MVREHVGVMFAYDGAKGKHRVTIYQDCVPNGSDPKDWVRGRLHLYTGGKRVRAKGKGKYEIVDSGIELYSEAPNAV